MLKKSYHKIFDWAFILGFWVLFPQLLIGEPHLAVIGTACLILGVCGIFWRLQLRLARKQMERAQGQTYLMNRNVRELLANIDKTNAQMFPDEEEEGAWQERTDKIHRWSVEHVDDVCRELKSELDALEDERRTQARTALKDKMSSRQEERENDGR